MQCCTLLFKYKRKFKAIFGNDLVVRLKSSSSSNGYKLNLLFFGTDQFSLRSLDLLKNYAQCEDSKINQLDVVTSFKGKGNPVKKYAAKNNMNCCDWLTLNSGGAKIKYDLGVVVSFGHLIPENIIEMFPLGLINVHGSLLPRWRGASPIIYAILNEDKTTGVSLMKIHPKKFDIGEILAQKEVEIPANVLMPQLHETLANDGGELLVDFIKNAPDSFQNARPQGDDNVTYAPKVPESLAFIDWHTMSSKHICNLYRALFSFKWLTTSWHKRRLRIRELDLTVNSVENIEFSKKLPGTVEYDRINKCLRVYCCDSHFVQIKQLSLEGKSLMSATDFNNGFLKKVDIEQRYFT